MLTKLDHLVKIMSSIETNAIYMVTYFRSFPPGDPFHWGLYVATNDNPGGNLFHVIQRPSWQYIPKSHTFLSSDSAIQAAKIGFVPSGTTLRELETLFGDVPVGESQNYTGQWRCNNWVRDAVRQLVVKGLQIDVSP
jgi:hypothetical protein